MSNSAELKILIRKAFLAQEMVVSGWVSDTETGISIFPEKDPENHLGMMSVSKAIELGTKKPVTVVFIESLTPAEQSSMRQNCISF